MTAPIATDAFSTIRFFQSFEKHIKKIDTYPLASSNLIIHEDNYANLGEGDEDNGFAHLGFDVPTGNTVLLFSVDFCNDTCVISIDGQPGVEMMYQDIDAEEEKASLKLIELLKALANGQIFTVLTCTEDNEQVQAVEVIYRAKGASSVIMTYPIFDSQRKLNGRELNYFLHQNKYNIGEVSLDPHFIVDILPEQEFRSFNRSLVGNTITPLSRLEWEATVEKYYENKTDEYAAEVIRKIDRWSKSGPQGSFKEIYMHYAEKRHANLTLLLMLANVIVAFGIGTSNSAVALMAVTVLIWGIVFTLRNHVLRHILHKPLAYLAVIATIINLAINQHQAFFYYAVVIVVAIEIIECIILDIIEWSRTR